MAKRNKNTSSNGHNKIGSIILIPIGIILTIMTLVERASNPYFYEWKFLLGIGLIMLVLGGIMFKKSFLSKN